MFSARQQDSTYHLVLRLDPVSSTARVPAGALVLRLKPAEQEVRREIQSLSTLETSRQQIGMVIDLSTKEQWKHHYMREMDYSTLLAEVMPKLNLPNAILLDPEFIRLPRSDQKNTLKSALR